VPSLIHQSNIGRVTPSRTLGTTAIEEEEGVASLMQQDAEDAWTGSTIRRPEVEMLGIELDGAVVGVRIKIRRAGYGSLLGVIHSELTRPSYRQVVDEASKEDLAGVPQTRLEKVVVAEETAISLPYLPREDATLLPQKRQLHPLILCPEGLRPFKSTSRRCDQCHGREVLMACHGYVVVVCVVCVMCVECCNVIDSKGPTYRVPAYEKPLTLTVRLILYNVNKAIDIMQR